MPFAIIFFLCLRQRELNNKIQIWWISNEVVKSDFFFQHGIENQREKKFAYSVEFNFVSIGYS